MNVTASMSSTPALGLILQLLALLESLKIQSGMRLCRGSIWAMYRSRHHSPTQKRRQRREERRKLVCCCLAVGIKEFWLDTSLVIEQTTGLPHFAARHSITNSSQLEPANHIRRSRVVYGVVRPCGSKIVAIHLRFAFWAAQLWHQILDSSMRTHWLWVATAIWGSLPTVGARCCPLWAAPHAQLAEW